MVFIYDELILCPKKTEDNELIMYFYAGELKVFEGISIQSGGDTAHESS